MQKVKFTIITLFEDAVRPYLEASMMWKAKEKGIAEFDFVNLRDFGLGPHKSVDDTPYGGGDGMVLRCEPVYAAIESVKEKDPEAIVILPTPDGELWTEKLARELAGIATPDTSAAAIEQSIMKKNVDDEISEGDATSTASRDLREERRATDAREVVDEYRRKHYAILCPHYEGYDERILPLIDRKICLGPYVLTGGELPALIIIDSIVRLLPGVLGGDSSAAMESFSDGDNIEAPQYTKPADFRGLKVPEILLSGDHGKVARWRKDHEKSLGSHKNRLDTADNL